MKHLKTFKDSSGRECVQVLAPVGWTVAYRIGSDTDEEVAAYYRKREDEQLGRWRDPENPDWICYGRGSSSDTVHVINEYDGLPYMLERGQVAYADSEFSAVAQRYFEAHPKPKEPQEGEIWDIEMGGGAQWRCVVRDGWFVPVNLISGPYYAVDDEHIVRKEFIL